ncbi:MAG: signal peptidase II [Blautia sp.]
MKSEKKLWFTYISLVFISGILTLLDQWTKQLAVTHLQNQPDISLISGVLSLHYLENRGAAFGIFQNRQIFFLLMTTVILLFIFYALWKMPQTKKYMPLRLLSYFITAGAVGNLLDRIRLGYVVDFIYFSLIDFPVFNVADIYVTVSMVILLTLVLFFYKNDDDFAFLARSRKDT